MTPHDIDQRIFLRLIRHTQNWRNTTERPETSQVLRLKLPNGDEIWIDPEKVLKQRVSAEVIAQALSDPDSFDDSYMHEAASGRLRGGSRSSRDKDFGIRDHGFWDWWHQEKQRIGARDISTREEAEELYERYEHERLHALRRSGFYTAIETIPLAYRPRLRAALLLLST